MNTRFLLVGLLLACFLGAAQAAPTGSDRPPNILFILCDDLGINDLHCYGRQDHRTPHLDKLARQGMRFTSAYCAQPICSPSRAAMLTGKSPARLHLTTFLPGRPDCSSQKVLHPEIQMQVPLEEKMIRNNSRRPATSPPPSANGMSAEEASGRWNTASTSTTRARPTPSRPQPREARANTT